MRWKNIILTLVLITSTSLIYCQKSLNEIEGLRKNAISFNFFGTTPVIGITYERLIIGNFSAEIGVGFPSLGLGVKLFPWKIVPGKLRFHVGVTLLYTTTEGNSEPTHEMGWQGLVIYFPIGFSLYGKRGFNFGFDFGLGNYWSGYFGNENGFNRGQLIPWGNLKFGYRF